MLYQHSGYVFLCVLYGLIGCIARTDNDSISLRAADQRSQRGTGRSRQGSSQGSPPPFFFFQTNIIIMCCCSRAHAPHSLETGTSQEGRSAARAGQTAGASAGAAFVTAGDGPEEARRYHLRPQRTFPHTQKAVELPYTHGSISFPLT